MRKKLRHTGLLAGIVGLLATAAPPAHADTYGVLVFTGTATVGGPLGYPNPVTQPGLGLPTVPPPCHGALPLPSSTLLTIGGVPVPDVVPRCHFNPGGHTRSLISLIGSSLCVIADTSVDKLTKPSAHVNAACGFGIAAGKAPEGNHVHGYCGLSGGQVQQRFTDGLGQAYTLDTHFTAVADVFLVTAHTDKLTNPVGQNGKFYAVLRARPIPSPLPVGSPHPPNNTCLGNTATVFTLVGVGVFVPHPVTVP